MFTQTFSQLGEVHDSLCVLVNRDSPEKNTKIILEGVQNFFSRFGRMNTIRIAAIRLLFLQYIILYDIVAERQPTGAELFIARPKNFLLDCSQNLKKVLKANIILQLIQTKKKSATMRRNDLQCTKKGKNVIVIPPRKKLVQFLGLIYPRDG